MIKVSNQAEFDAALAAGARAIEIVGSPTIETRGSSSPIIETRGSSSPIIETRESSLPTIRTRDTSSPIIMMWGSSSPTIETRDSSSPTIETWDSSSPTIETRDSSSPTIETRDSSSPTIETWESSAVKGDLWMVLTLAKREALGLLAAVREGRIDGSTSLAGLHPNSTRPIEKLFRCIKPGKTPSNWSISKLVEGWILEWLALNDIADPAVNEKETSK